MANNRTIVAADVGIFALGVATGYAVGRYVKTKTVDATVKMGEAPAPAVEDFAARYKGLFYQRQKDTSILPEVALAQAIVESANSQGDFGKGVTALNANNYFGIKADQSWKGDIYYVDADGQSHVGFRQYASPEDSINDYYDFLSSNANYKIDLTTNTAEKQIDAIAAGGYASGSGYANLLKQVAARARKILLDVDDKYHKDIKSRAMAIAPYVGGIFVLGAVVTLMKDQKVFRPAKKKISGATDVGEWFVEHPLETSIIAGLIVAGAVGYWAGLPKHDTPADQNIDWSKLPDPTGLKYADIADQTEAMATHDTFVSSELIGLVKDLTTDELKAVAQKFGQRQWGITVFGLKVPVGGKGSIFYFYNNAMSDTIPYYYLSQMKKIWSPTNLWVG
jgi:hypothetical protein